MTAAECELDGFPAVGESDWWPGVMVCAACAALIEQHAESRTTAVIG